MHPDRFMQHNMQGYINWAKYAPRH